MFINNVDSDITEIAVTALKHRFAEFAGVPSYSSTSAMDRDLTGNVLGVVLQNTVMHSTHGEMYSSAHVSLARCGSERALFLPWRCAVFGFKVGVVHALYSAHDGVLTVVCVLGGGSSG